MQESTDTRLPYLAGYPDETLAQVRPLLASGQLGERLTDLGLAGQLDARCHGCSLS